MIAPYQVVFHIGAKKMSNSANLKSRSKPFVLGLILGFSVTSVGGVYAALPILNQGFPIIERVVAKIDSTKQQLNLSASQQLAWQRAAESSQRLAQTTKTDLSQLRTDGQRLLTKPVVSSAELRQFFSQLDSKRDASIAERRVIREQWLAVYEQLTPEQQSQLRTTIKTDISHFERLQQRFGNDKS